MGISLELGRITPPARYIRDIVIPERLRDYKQLILDEIAQAKKDKRDFHWPFPPILVRGITKDKKGYDHEIMDGVTRFFAAVEANLKTIPVAVRQADEAHAFANQLTENLRHGAYLTHDERDAAIKDLVYHFKLSRKAVAELTNLTDMSIGRILAGKQRKSGPRKKGGGRPKKGTVAPSAAKVKAAVKKEVSKAVKDAQKEYVRREAQQYAALHVKCPTCANVFKAEGNEVAL